MQRRLVKLQTLLPVHSRVRAHVAFSPRIVCLCLLPVFVRACLRARLSVSLMFAVAPSVD